uniref:Serine/threonine-protein phosphatase n=2 Tax=Caenorhabditis japonica TaxID=281687 RepID=A0A8R1DZ28_CAEJA
MSSIMSREQVSVAFAPTKVNLDKYLERLMNIGKLGSGFTTTIEECEISDLIAECNQVFTRQPMMIECAPPVSIVGDIHGQFGDLMRIFNTIGFPPEVNYLFLGDYIDRGQFSVETMLILMCIKMKYPENFILLRGNHETKLINRIYGFYDDLNKRFGTPRLYDDFTKMFEQMPLTGLVGKRILCMHGGLSNDLMNAKSLDILNAFARPLHDPPNPSLAIDVLWADPDVNTKGFKANIRGCSCTFGPDVVAQTCEKFQLDLIVRAHQVVQDGYEFFANKKLVTLFSAPHYCGQFDNAGAIMQVSPTMVCSFKILRPEFPSKGAPSNQRSTTTILLNPL